MGVQGAGAVPDLLDASLEAEVLLVAGQAVDEVVLEVFALHFLEED